jgi:hypothetical protein
MGSHDRIQRHRHQSGSTNEQALLPALRDGQTPLRVPRKTEDTQRGEADVAVDGS